MIRLAVISLLILATSVYASTDEEVAKLYATRLVSVDVPKHIVEESAKKLGASISRTYIYVVLSADGKPVWISPKQKLIKNQTKFEWPNSLDSTATLLWDKDTPVTVRVILSDNMADAIESSAAIGGLGGAGVGAAIGGVLAGVFTGGLGAPAGAAIGALIGGGIGGAAGGATGALSATDRILFEIEPEKQVNFPLNETIKYTTKTLGEQHIACVSFKLHDAEAAVEQGTLELGKKYIVRLRKVMISSLSAKKGEKDAQQSKYYVVFNQGDKEYKFYDDKPLSIPTNIPISPSIYTVLKNSGESTKVQIYEADKLVDDLVFSSTIGKIDGKSWVFIDKATADEVNDSSYALFETFGPLK